MAKIPTRTTDEIFMNDLKEEFMQSVSQNLRDLEKLFGEEKYEEIAKIAHDIKGTSGVFGMDEGTEIAAELQYAARDQDAEKTGALIRRLKDYMMVQIDKDATK